MSDEFVKFTPSWLVKRSAITAINFDLVTKTMEIHIKNIEGSLQVENVSQEDYERICLLVTIEPPKESKELKGVEEEILA